MRALKLDAGTTGEKLQRILRNLIVYRILVVTTILISSILIQVYTEQSLSLKPLYVVIIITYGLTIVYAAVYNRINDYIFAYAQLIGDALIISAIVFLTEGIDSPFTFLYSITIIIAGILFNKRGFIVFSIISIVLLGLTTMLHYLLVEKTFPGLAMLLDSISSLFLIGLGLTIIGFLSNYSSEQLRKAVGEIQEKQRHLENLRLLNKYILFSLKSGIIAVDLDNRLSLVNRAAKKILNLSETDYFQQDICTIFPNFNDLILQRDRRIILQYQETGAVIHLGLSITELKDNQNQTIGYLIILQDLTRIKKLEAIVQMKEKLATIGEMSAVIAHELKNPLASITGSVELLQERLPFDADSKKLADIVVKESRRLNRKIKEFLEYGSLRKPDKRTCNINEIVEEVLLLFRQSLQPGIEMVFSPEENPLVLAFDVEQIKEVLWNLLKNSFESLGETGRIEVTTGVRYKKPNEIIQDKKRVLCNQKERLPYVVLTIQDTGKGIDAERLAYIFKPFASGKKEGFGIGLAVVNSIIDKHDGWIEVDTAPRKGCTFLIYLPMECCA